MDLLPIEYYLEIIRNAKSNTRIKSFCETLKNTGLQLVSHGKSYTSDQIMAVHNIEEKNELCPYCGCGSFFRYAVESHDHCFFVIDQTGECLTYSGEDPKVITFDTKSEMDQYLISQNYEKEEISDEMVASRELKLEVEKIIEA